MSLPGTSITVRETPPSRTPPTDTGVWFIAGLADQGELKPTLVTGIADFVTKFGDRQTYSLLYDELDAFFAEGGSRAYVSRVVGPAAVQASFMLLDSVPAATLQVRAISPGAWGNALNVAVLPGDAGGEFKLQVSHDTLGVLETSPSLVDKTAAIAWAVGSRYVELVDQASVNDPAVVAAQSLVGGTDDRANVTDTQWNAALNLFTRDLGPGQESFAGRTTDTAHQALLAHAAANGRVALLDMPDTSTVATLTASATAARANGRYGAAFAPWAVVPGIPATGGTPRTVPYSAIVAGILARNDAIESPNLAAAGKMGQAVYATGLSQPAWTEGAGGERETLNNAGVNVALVKFGGVRTYGWRSLADPASDPNWVQFTNARVVMAIAAEGDAIAENYVFAQLDGAGLALSAYRSELAGMLLRFYRERSLYGATPEDAFSVNVGPDVNTAQTIAAGELHAVITIVPSPFAERVEIEIVKRLVTEGVL